MAKFNVGDTVMFRNDTKNITFTIKSVTDTGRYFIKPTNKELCNDSFLMEVLSYVPFDDDELKMSEPNNMHKLVGEIIHKETPTQYIGIDITSNLLFMANNETFTSHKFIFDSMKDILTCMEYFQCNPSEWLIINTEGTVFKLFTEDNHIHTSAIATVEDLCKDDDDIDDEDGDEE